MKTPPLHRSAIFRRVIWLLAIMLPVAVHGAPPTRSFVFAYYTEVPAQPLKSGTVDIFVPLAVSDTYQSVLNREVLSDVRGAFEEDVQGNLYWHGRSDPVTAEPIKVQINYVVRRRGFDGGELQSPVFTFTPEEEEFHAGNSAVDRDVRRKRASLSAVPLKDARHLYDRFIELGCAKDAAGCHPGRTTASFVEFVHAAGAPARIECGVRVPPASAAGQLKDSLCWAVVHTAGSDWVPVDIAAACEGDSAVRDSSFAPSATDRIRLAMPVGLREDQEDERYDVLKPRVERAGKPIKGVKTRVYFREVRPTTTAIR